MGILHLLGLTKARVQEQRSWSKGNASLRARIRSRQALRFMAVLNSYAARNKAECFPRKNLTDTHTAGIRFSRVRVFPWHTASANLIRSFSGGRAKSPRSNAVVQVDQSALVRRIFFLKFHRMGWSHDSGFPARIKTVYRMAADPRATAQRFPTPSGLAPGAPIDSSGAE